MRILRIVPSSLSIRVIAIHSRRIPEPVVYWLFEGQGGVEIPSPNETHPIKYISLKTWSLKSVWCDTRMGTTLDDSKTWAMANPEVAEPSRLCQSAISASTLQEIQVHWAKELRQWLNVPSTSYSSRSYTSCYYNLNPHVIIVSEASIYRLTSELQVARTNMYKLSNCAKHWKHCVIFLLTFCISFFQTAQKVVVA